VRTAVRRWLPRLVVWLAFLLLQAPLRAGFGAGAGAVTGLVLLPGAVPAAGDTVLLSQAARALLPGAMERSLDEFGPLGPVFTFHSWLIAVFLVAVSGLALGEYVASTAWYRAAAGRLPFTRIG